MTPQRGASAPLPPWLDAYEPVDDADRRDAARTAELLSGTVDPFDRSRPIHVTGSALVLDLAERRVLLRWHERQRAWLQVGGHADPGEDDPLAIAVREGLEETGLRDLAPWPPGPAGLVPVQIVVVAANASATEAAHEHADVRFLLATGSPLDARPESEAAPLRWLTVPEAISATNDSLAVTIRRAARLF